MTALVTALVDVVLPCLDEAAALPGVLAALPEGYRAIVVDNGSSDDSAAIARRWGALVVGQPIRGFGSAAHAGLEAASAPLIAFCDADGSLDLGELPAMAELVRAGTADLVLARRRPSRGAWPWHARLANRVLAGRIRRLTGVPLHDLGPLRIARRGALIGLELADRRSGYPLEMVLKAAAAGWRIVEVDGAYAPRIGHSKISGTVRGSMTAVHDMTRLLRGYAR